MRYICTKCYTQYNNDIQCEKCGTQLINIDKLMSPIISTLNKKGYETISCCSGHDDNHPRNKTYIKFKNGCEPSTLPNNFIKFRDRNDNTIICKYCNKLDVQGSILKSMMDLFNWILTL